MSKKKTIAVIGGGLGGLAASIRLQSRGHQVLLFEKNDHTGGKLHDVRLGTYTFDFGPNTITMPHVFQNVLQEAGESPDDYFTFERLTTHTKNAFPDGSSFCFSSDPERMEEELAGLDLKSAKGYRSYLKEVSHLYELADTHFLKRTFSSWKDYMSLPLAKALMSVKPLRSLDAFHRQFFSDGRIVQAFNRYATYIGSSPYRSPATFALIGHLELNDGVYYTKGGNVEIAKGLTKAARKLGVTILTGTEIERIETSSHRVTGVVTKEDHFYKADGAVMNGDLLTQVPSLLDERVRPGLSNKKMERFSPSVSAFVMMVAVRKRFDLHHHHVFFNDDYKGEFESIFTHQSFAKDPTIYICTSSKTDPMRSPDGDNLFILVNAPPLTKEGLMTSDTKEYETLIFDRLKGRGIDIQPFLESKKTVTPKDIANRFYAYRGSLYGIASNRRSDTFLRPYNQSADLSNLFFAGGSTHPGGGSPMVILSGMNAADSLIRELGK
ncbi:phytoene desaturase [Bacillus sp. H-16]|uniref:phytoene desaturase family protein n=1 Tax=Alteribacter salitolerans TaxID=2912333 RepID=UPI001963B9A7|nr:phytoene desaturase family protein [Alteribacter salitolerans]MBM7097220.1 phytoene desaturase [Alteribacter salitolerans]